MDDCFVGANTNHPREVHLWGFVGWLSTVGSNPFCRKGIDLLLAYPGMDKLTDISKDLCQALAPFAHCLELLGCLDTGD